MISKNHRFIERRIFDENFLQFNKNSNLTRIIPTVLQLTKNDFTGQFKQLRIPSTKKQRRTTLPNDRTVFLLTANDFTGLFHQNTLHKTAHGGLSEPLDLTEFYAM